MISVGATSSSATRLSVMRRGRGGIAAAPATAVDGNAVISDASQAQS
jgi:hypothetical protein